METKSVTDSLEPNVDLFHEDLHRDTKTDGCTLFPDGNYRHCCVDHDEAYQNGGTYQDRLDADVALRECVYFSIASGNFDPGSWPWWARGFFVAVAWNKRERRDQARLLADLIYRGVRIGGHRAVPFVWRWGKGGGTKYQF